MSENRRGHWRIQIVTVPYMPAADPNGIHQGIQFTNGFAYVNWQTLGEAATKASLDRLGHDDRFHIVEIPERTYTHQGVTNSKKNYPL